VTDPKSISRIDITPRHHDTGPNEHDNLILHE
jgi:hypothetical protein